MLANWITMSRLPLLLCNVLILFYGSPGVRLIGVGLLLAGLLLDTVDGVVARRRHEASLFGSVLDIAVDRAYELVLWVCFAYLRLVPVAIPVLVIVRTTLTDALRGLGVGQGTSPFRQHRTRLAQFIVGSTPMRVGYSVSKIAAFVILAIGEALGASTAGAQFRQTGLALAWLATALCLVRGIPVLVHGLKAYWSANDARPSPMA